MIIILRIIYIYISLKFQPLLLPLTFSPILLLIASKGIEDFVIVRQSSLPYWATEK
jgi:Na+-transporting methylmalonyl-CoA/oxaloacetate decarboxylase beta subunit